MHCKASHASCDQLSTNQRNVSEITFGAGTTKINLKILKSWLWKDDLMQETICRHYIYSDGRFWPLTNSGKSLTSAYNLKALILSS